MKYGNVKICIEVSQTEYAQLIEGAKLLREHSLKPVQYSPESFLRYAVSATLDELVNEPVFHDN